MMRPALRRGLRALIAAVAGAGLLALSGCGATLENQPLNEVLRTEVARTKSANTGMSDTLIGLSFSGGGTRAAAFSFGVLKELQRTRVVNGSRDVTLAGEIDFLSSVSGGSVTAAAFALHREKTLRDFREKFLLVNVEASLRTSLSLANVLRASLGGVNDRTGLQDWLDRNLFEGATFGDVADNGGPIVWINASDIYNRTPFVFNQQTFAAICSDLSSFPLSEAVAASAAVPLVFAPVVLKNYAPECPYETPDWVPRMAGDPEAPAVLRANAEAIQRYRRNEQVQFVKLLDGGLTDNLGLSGLVLAKLAAKTPYEPLKPAEAIRMERMLFIIVDSGRPPAGDWAKTPDGPEAQELILAVSDTAIDANVRGSYDYFSNLMSEWRRELIDYRCGLSPAEVQRIAGVGPDWQCDDLDFFTARVAFDQMQDEKIRDRLDSIPTRFKLPEEDVDLLIRSAGEILRADDEYRAFLKSFSSEMVISRRMVPVQ
ncbi:patatin-like phospholipase family protein [Dichotomicrobium thermohalophilum]|nr:patatin-like phospholipase family protein [Dichotomicrobium thermohalophilum]